MKNGGSFGDKKLGAENASETFNRRIPMKFKFFDFVLSPFRFLLNTVLGFAAPEFAFQVFDETPLIARRVIEAAISEVGIEGQSVDLPPVVDRRIQELREEHRRLLSWYTLLAGFECREALWLDSFLEAMDRRVGL